jgi:hypothetical protein
MTISEQSAVLLQAVEFGLVQAEDIVRWSDRIVASLDKPPTWLIDLSGMPSPHITDLLSILRQHAGVKLPMAGRIQVIVLAFSAGLLPFQKSLSFIFQVVMVDRIKGEDRPEGLVDALVEWDSQEDLDAVGPALKARFERLFEEALQGAGEIAEVLPWKFQRGGKPPGA